ncbi:MAG: MoaD/ThiS family protein [Burkholderiaceae bacterium]|nr:MoaD/ThiS family protein [Burkholderiaceae bacterium]
MTIQLRYFASLREALGSAETVEVADGATVAQVRDQLIARGAPHADALARGKAVRAAVDQALSDESARLHDGAELAFFPPVTGG